MKGNLPGIHSLSSVVQEDLGQIALRVGPPFDQLQGKKILITGGTGFVGSHLVECISYLNREAFEKHCQVYVLTRYPERYLHRFPHLASRKELVLFKGDVRTFEYPSKECDFIIHAASSADPQALQQNPLETIDVIVTGTRKVLEVASRTGVQRLLFLSSGAVYGPQPSDLESIPEDYLGGPDIQSGRGSYGEAKRYAETLCQVFRESKKVDTVIARMFTFVGPYQDMNSSFAIVEFIRHSLRGEPIRIKGDGRAVRTFCYSADMAVALWKILFTGAAGEIYNVGSDCDPVSIEELAGKVKEKINPGLKVSVEGHGKGDALRPRYVPDISKLKKRLGFSIRYGLDTCLDRTFAHLSETGIG